MEETVPSKIRKLNTSIDVIPIIQDASDDSPQLIPKKRSDHKKPNHLYNKLKSRVHKYLSLYEGIDLIDPGDIAEAMIKDYPDYININVGLFTQMVRRACDDLPDSSSKKPGNNYEHDEDEEEEEDDDAEIEIESDSELVDPWGKELLELYKQSSSNDKNGHTSDKELIDISSDDDSGSPGELKSNETEKPTQFKNNTLAASQSSVFLKNPSYNCQGLKRKNPTKPIPDLTRVVDGVKLDETRQQQIINRGKKRSRDRSLEESITLPQMKKRNELSAGFLLKSHEKRYKFCDIGWNTNVLKSVVHLLKHIQHPEVLKHLSAPPTRGVLLHGPPGCGKFLIARAIAGELNALLLKTSATELIAGGPGKGESRVRELFEQSLTLAPCVLFFDEIDKLSSRNSQGEIEHRIVGQLVQSLNELSFKKNGDKVLVLGAASRRENINPVLLRPGKFDREISIGVPDKNCRVKILEIHSRNVPLSEEIDLAVIAEKTAGFVGADLVSLLHESAISAADRFFEQQAELDIEKVEEEKKESKNADESKDLTKDKEAEIKITNETTEKENSQVTIQDDVNLPGSSTKNVTKVKKSVNKLEEMLHKNLALSPTDIKNLKIENIDFEAALKVVQPRNKGENFLKVPSITWENIGALKEIREELQQAIVEAVKYQDNLAELDYNPPTGVLLCGPPGCGKTLLAKAIANEAGINLISVNGLQSEEEVRQCFARARDAAPCVVFFDDIDSLCPRRREAGDSSTLRVVNRILKEMDGFEERKGVYILAATNRPDILDPAVVRTGRFERVLWVGLPGPDDRVDILRVLTKNGTLPKVADDVSLEAIGKSERCSGFTCADLNGLVKQAVNVAVKERSRDDASPVTQVHMRHFEIAFDKVRPSVSEKEAEFYEKLRKRYGVGKLEVVGNLGSQGQSQGAGRTLGVENRDTEEAMDI